MLHNSQTIPAINNLLTSKCIMHWQCTYTMYTTIQPVLGTIKFVQNYHFLFKMPRWSLVSTVDSLYLSLSLIFNIVQKFAALLYYWSTNVQTFSKLLLRWYVWTLKPYTTISQNLYKDCIYQHWGIYYHFWLVHCCCRSTKNISLVYMQHAICSDHIHMYTVLTRNDEM